MNTRSLISTLPCLRRVGVVVAAAMLLLLTSCDRRPLEVYFENMVQVRVDVDWMSRYGELPSGMTISSLWSVPMATTMLFVP